MTSFTICTPRYIQDDSNVSIHGKKSSLNTNRAVYEHHEHPARRMISIVVV